MQLAKRITLAGAGTLALLALSNSLAAQKKEPGQVKGTPTTKKSAKTKAATTPLWQFEIKGIRG